MYRSQKRRPPLGGRARRGVSRQDLPCAFIAHGRLAYDRPPNALLRYISAESV